MNQYNERTRRRPEPTDTLAPGGLNFIISIFTNVKLGVIYEIQGPSWIKQILQSSRPDIQNSYHGTFVISYKDGQAEDYEMINYRNIQNNLYKRDKLFFALVNLYKMRVDVTYFPDIIKEENMMYEKWSVTL